MLLVVALIGVSLAAGAAGAAEAAYSSPVLGGPIYNSNNGAALISEGIVETAGMRTDDSVNDSPFINSAAVMAEGGIRREGEVSGYRLPEIGGYFIMPTNGWNWGQLHYNNAVDIAGVCGSEVYAAQSGAVSEEAGEGWSGGYGSYVAIEHPNGTKTLYAHTSKNLATAGDLVMQGEVIALTGNTGNVNGETGCHLHFEVHGAANPFAKY